jgi:hypothetical protein
MLVVEASYWFLHRALFGGASNTLGQGPFDLDPGPCEIKTAGVFRAVPADGRDGLEYSLPGPR